MSFPASMCGSVSQLIGCHGFSWILFGMFFRSWSPRNRLFVVRCELLSSCVLDMGALFLVKLVGRLRYSLVLFPV